VNDILAGLSPEEKKLFRIIDRKQIDKVGGNPEVALALSGENGASFGNAVKGEAVKPGHGGAHGYYPDFQEIRTGFVACGPGIQKGAVIAEMNLRDITPALAKLLGLSMPVVDGKIPANLLTK
jgi:predicted AlkP superfamily pyrophosphatase or phosphodiesterase